MKLKEDTLLKGNTVQIETTLVHKTPVTLLIIDHIENSIKLFNNCN